MQTEIEAKWINIDLDLMRKKLDGIGALLIKPERIMTRSVFDFPDWLLAKLKIKAKP
jgi:hypothetical protein